MRITRCDHYARNTSAKQQIGTRNTASAALRTWLQRHVSSSTQRRISSLRQRYLFRMRPPTSASRAFANNRAIAHDQTTNRRIIAGLPDTRRG